MLFRVGSRYKTADDNGVSHFLEHMLYRGSPSLKTAHQRALAFKRSDISHAATQADYGTMNRRCLDSLAAATRSSPRCPRPRFSSIEIERGIVRERSSRIDDEGGRSMRTTSCADWSTARTRSPSPLVQLPHGLTMAQGGMPAAFMPGTMRGTTRQRTPCFVLPGRCDPMRVFDWLANTFRVYGVGRGSGPRLRH